MKYRTLGRTGLRVSLLSYGTGGPSNFGQSAGLSQQEQNALVQRCLDLGINLFDTSTGYSQSEEILGKGLKGEPRDSYIVATKWAARVDDEGLPPESEALTTSVERSLSRLGTDYVDIMMFHGLVRDEYHTVVERLYPAMKRFQEQGKIRFIGFSEMFREDPLHETVVLALRTHPDLWDAIMLKYGILNQYAAKEALPLAQKHDVGILNMAAVRIKLPNPARLEAQIADWKRRGVIPAEDLPTKDPLGWLVHDDVDSVISAGYKFAADHAGVSTVLTGTSSVEHLENNAAAMDKPLLPQPDKSRLVDLFGEIAEYA